MPSWLKVSGTFLEFDAGSDFHAFDRLAVGVDDDSADRPARVQFGGEVGRNRLIMAFGRPARPVRSVARSRDVDVEIVGRRRGSSITSCPSPSASETLRTTLPDELALADLLRPSGRGSCERGRGPPVSVSRPARRRATRILLPAVSGTASAAAVGFCCARSLRPGSTQMRQRDNGEQNQAQERPRARRGADRPLGIQQPANAEKTGGSRIQPEDTERSFQTAAATIGMPQNLQERFSGLDPGNLAQ